MLFLTVSQDVDRHTTTWHFYAVYEMSCRNFAPQHIQSCAVSTWAHCLAVTVHCTHSCSLQQSVFQWHTLSPGGESLEWERDFLLCLQQKRVLMSCRSHFSQLWARVKAPVMPCGKRDALTPNMGGTCLEVKKPRDVHHPIFSTTFLLCPFVKRRHQNIRLLCWNIFMFKGSEWIEHQERSKPFKKAHFCNRVTSEPTSVVS